VAGVELVATPAQHFSGRTLSDGNKTLWASWAMLGKEIRVFFSGDTGYFDGFKQIGEKFGPFDLTLMETGAYNANWSGVHMFPEQSLQAHIDLRGRWMLPVHNGTFDLAMHAWTEPFERIVALGVAQGVNVTTPYMGEPVNIGKMNKGSAWWRDVKTAAQPSTTSVMWASAPASTTASASALYRP
jgi:L-ascorbate metabolism protein UlaG (beta-lactamase superfamily)